MTPPQIKVINTYFKSGQEDIVSYCEWLKRKNSKVLHLIEMYVNQDLTSNDELLEIRNIILDVSGDIKRLPQNIVIVGDDNERL